jgi:ABC-type antimicrobial peptide transport system permease subunit
MDAYMCLGIKPEAMQQLGYELAEGRLLQPGDKFDAVFGAFAESMFHDPTDRQWWERQNKVQMGEELDPLVDIFNAKITMSPDYMYIYSNQGEEDDIVFEADDSGGTSSKPETVNVVGLLKKKDDWQTDMGVIFDINVLKKMKQDAENQQNQNSQNQLDENGWGWFSAIKGSQQVGYETVYVKCGDMNITKEVCDKIKEYGFYAYYPAEWVDIMREQAQDNQNFLSIIGAVSLFVAAIGIANTMIMAIYERTREIGVMKVIGASLRDIKWLFLIESALIGLVGGILGLGISYLLSYGLNTWNIAFFQQMFAYMGDQENSVVSLITPWLAGLALGFAATIGLVSGYFPARRAMRLSALTAIRTE